MNPDNSQASALPVLYSLRNCPYAMRARMAIFKAKQPVALRNVVLSDKPKEMIEASPKATVPVVVLSDGSVIDESLDVMLWALHQSDPDNLLQKEIPHALTEMLGLIHIFDSEFKTCLEQYRCAKRYHEDNMIECRIDCEKYIKQLENRLINNAFLFNNQEGLADIALLPFIRQFAQVERQWYLQSAYPNLRRWLNSYLQSPFFTKVMAKHPLWLDNREEIVFGG
ncbi:glutathione S-transferase [Corallincola luteus]|uniref:Glutathione S-transferase n=1 Tax=Corallincola luteus TaxID=1775177 RepID=A0ABY2AGR7_9GAMM|nr:glutathione S-transferase [Corallincola luteus]TCI01326.1 glutathione S-transferase [Corallincola luteus]